MQVEDLRISKLREYLFDVINNLQNDTNYQINANMLSNNINDYSIDKMPVEKEVENWIIGASIHRDVYSFRSRKSYSQEAIINLNNMGFFEKFENAIKTNNDKRILPDIENIESIKCLNPFTMNKNNDGKSAEFDIQIEITYREE